MEPDQLAQFDVETSLLGFAVLSAIPTVFFALWLDYFEKDTAQLKVEDPGFNKLQEVEKTRMACLLAMLLQLTFFLGFVDVRQAFAYSVSFIFMGNLFIEIFLQARTEKLIGLEPSAQSPVFKIMARAVVSWMIGVAFYLVILVISLRITLLFVEFSQVSKTIGAVILLLGGMVGSLLGFGFNFILSPYHLKKILPAQPLEDPALRRNVEDCFRRAGVGVPDLYMINLDPIPVHTLLVAGIQSGKGMLRQTFFISNSCVKNLTQSELEAMVLNHASHIALKHFRRRLILSVLLIFATIIIAVSAVAFIPQLVSTPDIVENMGPVIALALFFVSLSILNQQTKRHELEADIYTVNHLNVPFTEFMTALQKAENGHPDTEKRIQRVQLKLNRPEAKPEAKPEDKLAA